ncbi:MAG TPA: thioredoxin-dependent thiol peroxidase [Phototrophicaceae bacterium]|nr:thioredoxin-dependent thiol peroxidase [Phototrophicaceae bacterium]
MLKVGELAPDFTLVNQDNQTVHLSDYRGKKVVMFAYPAAGTSGCTTQACGFRDQFPKLEAKNVVVLGISPDKPADQLKWKQKEGLQYDLLCDLDHHVLEQWGAWGDKTNYGKTYQGVIRSHWIIDENGILMDQKLNVKPVESVEKAVAALEK